MVGPVRNSQTVRGLRNTRASLRRLYAFYELYGHNSASEAFPDEG